MSQKNTTGPRRTHKSTARFPILDIRHKRILESSEEALDRQGGKKFMTLAGSLGLVIYVSQHSVLGD